MRPHNPHSARPPLALGLAASVILASCSKTGEINKQADSSPAILDPNQSDFNGNLVDPPLARPDLVLDDTEGQRFNVARSSSKDATALFFGFTNCDNVCPTTMADLAAARRALPHALASRFVVVFVTVDPQRDTPRLLRRWLDRYDTDFIGLIGGGKSTHRAERSLYAPVSHIGLASEHQNGDHQPQSPDNPDYEVAHTGTVYVFGPDGESLIYTGGTTPGQYTEDVTRLLTSP